MAMSRQQVIDLAMSQSTTSAATAAHAMGLGLNAFREDIRSGRWPATRVLRSGRTIRIPTADIAAVLGIELPGGLLPNGEKTSQPQAVGA